MTNRDWRAAFGPAVTDHWFGGTDYDARREAGRRPPTSATPPSAVTAAAMDWRSAGIAPVPNLTTKLAARTAEPVKVQKTFTPVKLTNPQPGVWVFDFGQNFAGWPELHLPGGIPAGTVVRMLPARDAERQRDGQPGLDRRRRPRLGHLRDLHHARHRRRRDVAAEVQLLRDAVPAGDGPARRLHADHGPDPRAAAVRRTCRARVTSRPPTRASTACTSMSVYSTQSNTMSTFTDCPGREKLPYGADYVQPIGSLNVNFDYAAYLRNMEVQLVEGQSKAGADAGNVALKTPVYDWGYSGQFGDEINWGSSIVQVPWLLHKLYGDTQTMREHFDAMKTYMDFVARRKAARATTSSPRCSPTGSPTSRPRSRSSAPGATTCRAKYMSEMAALIGRNADAATYGDARGEHQDRVQRPVLQHDAAPLHGRRQRRDDRRDAGRAGDRARRRPRARGRAAERAAGAGGQHLRLPAVRRRPALQRRPRRARPGRALAAGGRSLGRPVGRHAGEHAAELRLHAAADRRAPGGHDHDARALDARRLAEPRDPAADRGVVPHRRGRHQAGAELDRLPRPGRSSRPRSATSRTPRATTPPRRARRAASGAATRPGITRFDVTVPANTKATVYVPATSAAQTFVATGSGDARYLRYEKAR